MDLKSTINNTNIQKENIKTVANNIDNKLVELGGERATDLSDVVNKMGAMVKGNYKKVAMGNLKRQIFLKRGQSIRFELPIDFKYTFVFIRVCHEDLEIQGQIRYDMFGTITNSTGNIQAATFSHEVEVRRVGDKGVEIIGNTSFNYEAYNRMYLEDWIAIG